MKTFSFVQFNRPFLVGLALMIPATLFWFGVFCEQILRYPVISEAFVSIDNITPVFSICFMTLFPLVAMFINASFLWKESKPIEAVRFSHFGNLLIAAYATLTVVMILGYLFTENVLGMGS